MKLRFFGIILPLLLCATCITGTPLVYAVENPYTDAQPAFERDKNLEWSRPYDGSCGYSIIQSDDGNFTVIGVTDSWKTPLLLTIDSSGNELQRKEIPGKCFDTTPRVVQLDDGGYITMDSGNQRPTFLIKSDSQGIVQLNKTIVDSNDFFLHKGIQTKDKGFAFVASSNSQLQFVKTDQNGDVQWTKTYEDSFEVSSFIQTSDEGFLLGGGNINRFLNDKKTVLLKLDSKGGVTWFKEYMEGRVYVVSECDDGGYVFVYREEDGSFDQTWFVKVAPDGEIDWRKTATHTEVSKSGTLYCLKKTSDGNFIAAGSWTSFVWVVKMSFSGGLLWNALYGGLDGNGSGVYDIIETNDGGLAFTGTSADRRIFVAKVAAFPEDYHNEVNVLESVWYCSYGPYTVSSVIPADDGGFVVAGQTAVLKHVDRGSIWVDKASLLLKVNAYGIEEWRKTFESISFENIETLVQANDGGYVLFGYARESNNSRQVFAVVKTDSMGNLEWHHEYRDNDYYCVMKSAIKTSDGGYAFAGTGHGNTSYEHLVLFYKIRASGNVQWTKQFKMDESQFAPLIVETDDGGFLVAYDLDKYARLKKVTANGVNQWIQEYTDAWLKVYCLAKSSTGGYLLAGGRATSKQYGESIAWIAKTDENGVVQWQKTFVLSGEYDPHRFNHFTGVYSTTDGGFILLAAQHSYSNWVLKIDSSGNLEWSQRLTSTPDQYYVTSVCVGDDNRLVIAGQVNERNIWLGKTGYTITVEKPVEGDNSSTSPQDSVDNGLLSNVSLFDLTVIATVTVVALATITYLFRKHRLTKQSTKQ